MQKLGKTKPCNRSPEHAFGISGTVASATIGSLISTSFHSHPAARREIDPNFLVHFPSKYFHSAVVAILGFPIGLFPPTSATSQLDSQYLLHVQTHVSLCLPCLFPLRLKCMPARRETSLARALNYYKTSDMTAVAIISGFNPGRMPRKHDFNSAPYCAV